MERVANHTANQSLDHAPIGADPVMRQAGPGGKIYSGAAVTYASHSEFEIESFESASPASEKSHLLKISNQHWGCP